MHYFYCVLTCLLVFSKVYAAPIITHINPAVGSSSGGTSLSITGSGFTGTTALEFGTVPGSSWVINSDTSLTVISPPHVPQVVSVRVTASSGTSIDEENTYYTFQGNWKAYVVNALDNTVSVVDTALQSQEASIPVGAGPDALAITPDGSQTFIANYGSFAGTSVSVLNNASESMTSIIPVGSGPNVISITPDGKQAYVGNYAGTTVSVIDVATHLISATISVGSEPDVIAITPDGSQAFVGNFVSGTVSMIEVASNEVLSTIGVGGGPVAIAITPNGLEAYVVNSIGNSVSVIHTADHHLIATIPVGSAPNALAITPDGSKVYVVNSGGTTVSVISTTTHLVSASIFTGNGPFLAVLTPSGEQLYVVNYNDQTVSVIQTSTNTVTNLIAIGMQPNALAITPDGKQIYFANALDNTLSVINTSTNRLSASIPVGDQPSLIAITPDQAPLAKFSVRVNGKLGTFDASASVSPVGTIADYFWDFGDGNTLHTAIAHVTHLYTTPGFYTVTLIVTNSAGTSTAQIFSFYSFSNNNFGTYSMPLENDGGRTASTSQEIVILPGAPQNFQGCQTVNNFSSMTDFVNLLTWKALPNDGVLFYRIYRDAALTDFVAEISASDLLQYEDHNRKQNKTYSYYLVSFGLAGFSSAVSITVTPKDRCNCH